MRDSGRTWQNLFLPRQTGTRTVGSPDARTSLSRLSHSADLGTLRRIDTTHSEPKQWLIKFTFWKFREEGSSLNELSFLRDFFVSKRTWIK